MQLLELADCSVAGRDRLLKLCGSLLSRLQGVGLALGGEPYRTQTRRDLMPAQTNNQRGQNSPVT